MSENPDLLSIAAITTLQMFAGIYKDFAGKSECGDFKFTGIACKVEKT